jgi:predicted Ser/Thr protein kinase
MFGDKLRLIGRGNSSSVWAYGEARAQVVLKVVGREHRREVRHLRHEWEVLRGLAHEGIVRALKYQENVTFAGTTMDR